MRKEALEELGALVIGLLMELTTQAPCAWNGKTVGDVAKNIIDTYWGLRVDELVYVFRKGVNGGYPDKNGETKIFHAISGAELSRWLAEYSGNERSEAEAYLRNQNKINETPVDENPTLKKETDELISALAKKMELKGMIEKNNHKRNAITHESIDRKTQQLVYQLNFNDLNGGLSDAEIRKFKNDAEKYNWPETLKFCNDEIKARAHRKNEGTEED